MWECLSGYKVGQCKIASVHNHSSKNTLQIWFYHSSCNKEHAHKIGQRVTQTIYKGESSPQKQTFYKMRKLVYSKRPVVKF